MAAKRRCAVNNIDLSRSRGLILVVIAVSMALLAAFMAGWLFDSSEKSKASLRESEAAALFALKTKIIEFATLNKRLPTITEYQDVLSKNFTDAMGRTPIYLVADNLDSTGNICLEAISAITLHNCEHDAACASPRITTQLPFALLTTGNAVSNPSAIVNQTTTATQNAVISSATTLTIFSPGTVVGSLADRTKYVALYDDTVLAGTFSELWAAAQCKSTSQGDVASKGVIVRILNQAGTLPNASVNIPYTTTATPFRAYGSDLSSYLWTTSTLPAGLTLTSAGNTAYIQGTPLPGSEGSKTITVSVTATSPTGNAPTHNVNMSLIVCEYWTETGSTQTLACPAGYTGSISQKEIRETCGGTTSWVDTVNTCTPIPLPTETTLNSAALAAAGADTSGRDLGVTTLTVNGVTITAGSSLHLSMNSSGTALGVTDPVNGGASIAGTDTITFYFGGGLGTTASIVFSRLGLRSTAPNVYDAATITFYSGATTVASITKTACSVTSDQDSTLVAFDSINPGGTFDRFVIQPVTTSRFYVAKVNACNTATCSTSVTPTATCP